MRDVPSTVRLGINKEGHIVNGVQPFTMWPVVSADKPDPLGGMLGMSI